MDLKNKNMEFKQYQRKGLSEMIAFKDFTEDISKVSMSAVDKQMSVEELNEGFIARNPKNHEDMWYVSKQYHDNNLEEVKIVDRNIDTVEILAHKLYDKYCKSVGGKAFNGDDLPKAVEFFNDESKRKQANAWRDTALLAEKLLA